jgi:DNA-binding CsgD family transcriptional regulator
MGIISLLTIFISLATGIACILISISLFTKYRIKTLSYLVFFSISYGIAGFLNLIGRHLLYIFCAQHSLSVRMMGNYFMVLLTLPFVVLALYFFIIFVSEIAEQHLSYLYSVWFFVLWLGIFIATLVGIKIMVETGENIFLRKMYQYVNIGITALYILTIFKLFWNLRRVNSRDKRNGLRVLGILYLFLLGAYFYCAQNHIKNYFGSSTFNYIVFFYYFVNIPPLLYLRYFLRRIFTHDALLPENPLLLEEFFAARKISNQEREVIKLILQGKDNRFIARRLSITYGTVKNHLYNIYRRLGIKSRLELVQMIRQYLQKKR